MTLILCDKANGTDVEGNPIEGVVLIKRFDACAYELIENGDNVIVSASLPNGQIIKMCSVKDINEGIVFIKFLYSIEMDELLEKFDYTVSCDEIKKGMSGV